MKEFIKILVIFLVIFILLLLIPNLNGEYIRTSKLFINEICSSNQSIIKDEDNEYSDYIELYNGYDYDIDLSGYYLSDSEFATSKWKFSNMRIKANSYLLIYASGKNKEGHTNFRLSSEGEVLTLSDKSGNIISKISYPKISPNLSYGYKDGKYVLMEPSPLEENKKIINNKKINVMGKIIINEYMSRNKSYNYDNHGYYFDWVEIKNISDGDINLSNIYLSDNRNNLMKYEIPNVIVKRDDYLVIYLAGEKINYNDNIYADFKIEENEEIILSDGKNIIDMVKVIGLRDNISYGLYNDTWYYFTSPTPGMVNDTAHFALMEEYNGSS